MNKQEVIDGIKDYLRNAMSDIYDVNRHDSCTPDERLQLLISLQLIEKALEELPQ